MDVVIIGAGLSGLTAAVTLQEAGISVQVLEADAQIGGRIRSVRDGARALSDKTSLRRAGWSRSLSV